MYKKQRLLLGLISHLSDKKKMTKLHLIKLMFLITKENTPKFSHYHFHPYKYGPFSYALYSDLNYFVQKNFLSIESNDSKYIPKLTELGEKEAFLSQDNINLVDTYLDKYDSVSKLIDEIYRNYPIFTCKSERKNIPKKPLLPTDPGIFLIGYEGKDIDEFLHELITYNITNLIDVRNNPRSMKYMFNKVRLKKSLANVGISYENIPELGIPTKFRQELNSYEDYQNLFAKYREILPGKETYINKILHLGKTKRISLMCFEKDEKYCHRGEIGKYIKQKGIEVHSI